MNWKVTEDAMPDVGNVVFPVSNLGRRVGSADSKETPRPVSAGSVAAGLLPLAASHRFATNIDVVRDVHAVVGRPALSSESVAAP